MQIREPIRRWFARVWLVQGNELTLVTGGISSPHTHDHVLVIDGDRSWSVELPPSGELVVGRSPEAGIVLADKQVSRAHLHLEISADDLVARDLGSRHGSRINGEPLTGARPVHTEDVLAVGGALLVVRRAARGAGAGTTLEHSSFDRRLAEELARAEARDRELALVVVRLAGEPRQVDAPAMKAWLSARLAVAEHAALLDDRHFAVALPELDADEAVARAAELVAGTPHAAGVAVAPYDAVTADLLVITARTAAARTEAGRVGRAADTVERIVLGTHTALVADAGMAQVYALTRRLARADVPVAIHGETGAGKELVALALHAFSPRAAGPFVAINCAAIPESLAEAELFGHARGAFTGAATARAGQLEAASGGTLFLDEVAELSPAMQARLLRALESGEIRRLGENTPRAIDVRVVCASLRNLRNEVIAARFRQDLFYRLATAQIELPALRQRPRDLAALTQQFVEGACARAGRRPLRLAPAAARAIARRQWAGNVRELRHAIEYAVATAPDEVRELAPWHLPAEAPLPGLPVGPVGPVGLAAPIAMGAMVSPAALASAATSAAMFQPIAEEIQALERRRMIEALRACGGIQVKAADLIEMPMRTFATKMRRYAIEPAEWE